MSDELTLRRPRAGDRERLYELNEVALRQVGAYAPDADDGDLQHVEREYVDAGGEFLVGTLDGELVAMGGLNPVDEDSLHDDHALEPGDGRAVEITRMRVAPDYQRRGYGSRILEALERRAVDEGFDVAVLDTTARQTGARRLYEDFGYEQCARFEWREYEVLFYRRRLSRRR